MSTLLYAGGHNHDQALNDAPPGWLASLVALLETHAGFSFEPFRSRHLIRAIHQESNIARFPSPDRYRDWLRHHPAQARSLALRLLNRTTRFFRDPEVFGFLKDRVLRPMVESRTSPRPIHIWVAGCATGEEAYSVAMCVSECLEETGIRAPVRIFATALSPLVLRAARAGIYPSRALAHVSQERLDRFFQKRNGDYVITRPIREMCRFARHDLANDVPLYGSLDLVTCRNVLLYLNRPTRLRILDAFHRALKPGGCLLLGKAEGMIENAGFRELDSRHRLFRKIPERGRA